MSKAFKKTVGLLGWLRIIAGYLFLGFFAGLVCYMYIDGLLGAVLLFALAGAGLVLGIWVASRVSRKMDSQEYLATLNKTPDLGTAEKEADQN